MKPKPYLFLDVDGVVTPVGTRERNGYRSWPGAPFGLQVHHLIPSWLRILDEAFDVMWCSVWEGDAPKLIGEPLDLPAWCHLSLNWRGDGDGWGVHRHKGVAIGGILDVDARPFAWAASDIEALTPALSLRGLPHQILKTRPDVGLTAKDIAVLVAFAAEMTECDPQAHDFSRGSRSVRCR